MRRLPSAQSKHGIARLWRRDLPRRYWPVWAVLTPISGIYAGVLGLRSRWWHRMAQHVDIPTISVGNLTAGGNGKTPFTLFLASHLMARGFNVGIVSRGYGRNERREPAALVSDGTRILMSPRAAGDESVMMAKSFAGQIVVARRRIDGVRLLIERAPVDVVLLDDGFQHLRLRRDLDLLLVNESLGFGNRWILPAGPLREPLTAVGRADAVVLVRSTGMDGTSLGAADRAALESRPIVRATLVPRSLVRSEAGNWRESPLEVAGKRVLAVSGIADPERFHSMIRVTGAKIAGTFDYPDHHDYGPADWENILAGARAAELVLTTEKDLVKLERFSSAPVSLYALRVEIVIDQHDEARLFDLVLKRLPKSQAARLPEACRSSL
jgi:tetraacyldisaccharide 4'-kinase